MNQYETELYQKIFSPDRIERWKSWQGDGNTKGGMQKGGTHPLAQVPVNNRWPRRWVGGVTVSNGYRFVLAPSHPRARGIGYVQEHVLVAEIGIGQFLPKGAIIHHKDGNKLNNSPDNLEILGSRREHNVKHRKIRAMAECGHADWLRCPICKQWDAPENLYVRSDHNRVAQARHRQCHADNARRRAGNNQLKIRAAPV